MTLAGIVLAALVGAAPTSAPMTLDQAVALLAEKSGKSGSMRRSKTIKSSRPASVSIKRATSAKAPPKAPRTAKASPKAATRKRAT